MSGKCFAAAWLFEFKLLELMSQTLTKKSNSSATADDLKFFAQFNYYW